MNASEKVAKLEALLARVKARAAEARPATNGGGAALAPAPAPTPAPTPAPAPAAPVARPVSMPPPSQPQARFSSIPPASRHDVTSYDADVDVEIGTEEVDVDIDVDEQGMPLESGAQMVGEEPPIVQAAANELVEPAPSSSPRPIASEQPETFEEESAPRHTPPPESGKQVAAPSVTPQPRKSSIPPQSLEGHTLIGGWREPGIPPGGAGGPGVRVPGPVNIPAEPVTATRTASVPPRASDRPLAADVTRAELPGEGAKVASFEGAVPTFQPSTFGELLDATLDL